MTEPLNQLIQAPQLSSTQGCRFCKNFGSPAKVGATGESRLRVPFVSSFRFLQFRKSVSPANELYKDNETGIGDIRISFPIYKNKWQTSFGISQYSKTNYNLFEISPIGPASDSLYNYETVNGQRGINQLNWKNGFKVSKNFNLGLESSYYLGNSQEYFDTRIKTTPDDYIGINAVAPNTLATASISTIQYKGLSNSVSFSYFKPMKSIRSELLVGGQYDLTSNLDIINNKIIYKIGLNDTTETTTSYNIPKGF